MLPTKECGKTVLHVAERDSDIAECMSQNAILTLQNAWKIMLPTKECRKLVLHVAERDSDIAKCFENYATHQGVQENRSACRRPQFSHCKLLGKLCYPPRS